jgi:hypothetical protein
MMSSETLLFSTSGNLVLLTSSLKFFFWSSRGFDHFIKIVRFLSTFCDIICVLCVFFFQWDGVSSENIVCLGSFCCYWGVHPCVFIIYE